MFLKCLSLTNTYSTYLLFVNYWTFIQSCNKKGFESQYVQLVHISINHFNFICDIWTWAITFISCLVNASWSNPLMYLVSQFAIFLRFYFIAQGLWFPRKYWIVIIQSISVIFVTSNVSLFLTYWVKRSLTYISNIIYWVRRSSVIFSWFCSVFFTLKIYHLFIIIRRYVFLCYYILNNYWSNNRTRLLTNLGKGIIIPSFYFHQVWE